MDDNQSQAPGPAPQRPPPWFPFRPSDSRVIQFLRGKIHNHHLPLHDIVETNVFLPDPTFLAGEHGYSEEKNELYFFSNTTNRVPSKWKLDTHRADTPIRDENGTQIGTKRRLNYVPNPQQDDKWHLDQYTAYGEASTLAVYKLYAGRKPARRNHPAAPAALPQDPPLAVHQPTQGGNTDSHPMNTIPIAPTSQLVQDFNSYAFGSHPAPQLFPPFDPTISSQSLSFSEPIAPTSQLVQDLNPYAFGSHPAPQLFPPFDPTISSQSLSFSEPITLPAQTVQYNQSAVVTLLAAQAASLNALAAQLNNTSQLTQTFPGADPLYLGTQNWYQAGPSQLQDTAIVDPPVLPNPPQLTNNTSPQIWNELDTPLVDDQPHP